MAVEAGDNQTGEPGVKLATKASVIVRDAGGRAVANVPVIFAVDSGGGTLAGGQAASGADGVATAGDWILGPAEGTNVLLATAAGLPQVRLRASGTYAGVTVTAGTLAASGGRLSRSGPSTERC